MRPYNYSTPPPEEGMTEEQYIERNAFLMRTLMKASEAVGKQKEQLLRIISACECVQCGDDPYRAIKQIWKLALDAVEEAPNEEMCKVREKAYELYIDNLKGKGAE